MYIYRFSTCTYPAHGRRKAWPKLVANLHSNGAQMGVTADDLWPERFNTCLSPLAVLVQLFLMLSQRQTKKEQRIAAWEHIQAFARFACRAATTDNAYLNVQIMPGLASALLFGTGGEVVGLEAILLAFPLLHRFWEAQLGSLWCKDKTGSIRLSSRPESATCADVILLFAMLKPSEGTLPFWDEVAVPLCRALFRHLAALYVTQAWRPRLGEGRAG